MLPEEQEFLEKLYRKMFPSLHQYATLLLSKSGFDANLADELVQDTFHTAALHIKKLMTHPNPSGWLVKALQYTFKGFRRQIYADNKRFLLLSDLPLDLPDPSSSVDNAQTCMECADVMARIRGALSEQDFRLFEILILNRASHRTAAQELGITIWTSQKRLSRIRDKLQNLRSP